MKNYRGTGDRVIVNASAARLSGQLVRESQWVGVCETDAASGQRVALRVRGEFEIPFVASSVKGDDVYISTDGLNTISRVAAGAARPASTQYVGKVSAVPGDTNTGTATEQAPAAGSMWVRLQGGSS